MKNKYKKTKKDSQVREKYHNLSEKEKDKKQKKGSRKI